MGKYLTAREIAAAVGGTGAAKAAGAADASGRIVRAAKRLGERRRIPVEGMIEDQGDPRLAGLLYGRYPVSYNACECVAVYNALYSAGRNVSFADLLTEFEENGIVGYFLFGKRSPFVGKFGSNPRKIARALGYYGIAYERTRREKTYRELLKNGDAFIASFINGGNIFRGVHTFFFTREGDSFRVYNGYGKRVCRDFDEVKSGSRFIVGYALSLPSGNGTAI